MSVVLSAEIKQNTARWHTRRWCSTAGEVPGGCLTGQETGADVELPGHCLRWSLVQLQAASPAVCLAPQQSITSIMPLGSRFLPLRKPPWAPVLTNPSASYCIASATSLQICWEPPLLQLLRFPYGEIICAGVSTPASVFFWLSSEGMVLCTGTSLAWQWVELLELSSTGFRFCYF